MSATIRGINVQIGSDTTGLSAALKDVNKNARDIAGELKQVERLLKFNPKDTELLAQKQKLLSDQVENTREKLDRLKATQEQVNEQFAKGEISEEQHRAFQRELVKTESQLKHFENQLRKSTSRTEQFAQKMTEVGKSMQDAGKKMSAVGKELSMKVTAPIVGIGAAAVATVAKFDDSMAKVQAISGATGDELESLRDLAQDLGSTTAHSASQAADAMGYLALAGWDTNQILEATPAMLSLASAASMDLASAADIVSDTMSMFRLEASGAGDATDIFAAASANSNTDIQQLGQAMTYAGASANAAGMDLQDTATALGILADSGIKGSKAGTAVNAMLRDMQANAKDGAIQIGEMAVQVYDADGAMRNFGAIMGDIEQATVGMTEEQRNQALSSEFQAQALRGVNVLLATGSEAYQSLETDIRNSSGAASEMANTMEDNIGGAFRALRSQTEGILIQLGDLLVPIIMEKIIPAVASMGESLSNLIAAFTTLSPGIQSAVLIIMGLVTALGPVLIVVGKVVTAVGTILPLLGKLALFVKAKLIPAIMGISAPVLGVIAAIAAFIAIGTQVYRHWEQVAGMLSATWELIKASVSNMVNGIRLGFANMRASVLDIVDDMVGNLSSLENLPFGIGEKFAGMGNAVGDAAEQARAEVERLSEESEKNSERMSAALDTTRAAFGDLGSAVAGDVKGVISSLTGMVTGTAEAMEHQTEAIDESQYLQSEVVFDESMFRVDAIEQSEQTQTQTVETESEARVEATEDAEEEQTDTVAEEAQKRAEARAKYEEDWNQELFKLTADRLEQLDAELEAELAKAEELGAGKSAIVEYYSIKRKEILDEELEQDEEREQKRLDTLSKFEQDWAKKLFESTADKLEILEAEKQEALAKAEELGADKTAIISYYAMQQDAILDAQAEEEESREQKRLEKLSDYQESWTRKVFEQSATRLEKLEQEKQEELQKAEELGAEKAAILEYYAAEEQKILDEQAQADEARHQEKLEALSKFEAQWSDQLFKATATNLETLEREKQETLAKAEELGADKTAIIEYYSIKQQEILDAELAKEAEREQKRLDAMAKFEQDWAKRIFESTATNLELLEREKQEALELAEELGASKTDVIAYYAMKQQEILDAQIKEESNRQQERLDTLSRFEELWTRKLFEQSATRLELIEREKQESLAKAEELGADRAAILEYYAKMEQDILDEQQAAEEKRQQERLDALRGFEADWADKLFESTATNLEILEREKQEALAKAEEMGAGKADIIEYYGQKEQEILTAQAEERQRIREEEEAAEQERLAAVDAQRQEWEERLAAHNKTELDILRDRMEEELALAEELGIEKTSIIEHYAIEEQKIHDKRRQEEEKAQQEELEAAVRLAEEKETARVNYEESWNDKLFRATADRLEILRQEKQDALKEAGKLGADKTKILDYYAREERRIIERRIAEERRARQEENRRVRRAAQEKEKTRVDYEESWNRKLFELTATREQLLEAERQRDLDRAEELGADKTAIIEYYLEKELEMQQEALNEKEKMAKKERGILQETAEGWATSYQNIVDSLVDGSKSIKDVLKELLIQFLEMKQKEVLIQQMAELAKAFARSWWDWTAIARAGAAILASTAAFEGAKALVRGLATGGVVAGGSDQVFRLGDGKEDEAVVPLNRQVLGDLGTMIAANMPGSGGGALELSVTINQNIQNASDARRAGDSVVNGLSRTLKSRGVVLANR